MVVLVVGGRGFIGSSVVTRLRRDGHQVLVGSRSVPASGGAPDRVTVDLADPIRLDRHVDAVVHVAGETKDQARMWEVNLRGTERLLDWALDHGVERVVFISTVALYRGVQDVRRIDIDTVPVAAEPYGASKLAAEQVIRKRCSRANVGYAFLRPSNVVGYPHPTGYPLRAFMRSVARRRPVIVGAGDAWLNYVDVENVSEAVAASLRWERLADTHVLNTPVRLEEAVRCVADALGAEPSRIRLPGAAVRAGARMAGWGGRYVGALAAVAGRLGELVNDRLFVGDQITRTRGFEYPVPISKSLASMARAYRARGMV